MRLLCLCISFILLGTFKSYSQLSLPKVVTTEKDAIRDLAIGKTNEGWFRSISKDGYVTYNRLFKITPVGISHAISNYEELIQKYPLGNCKDKSVISSLAIDSEGMFDFEMMALTIKTEATEISKSCEVLDEKISGINMTSLISGKNGFIVLRLLTTIK